MILKFYIMRFEQTNHFIYKKNFKKTHRLGARKRFLLRYEVKKISIGPCTFIIGHKTLVFLFILQNPLSVFISQPIPQVWSNFLLHKLILHYMKQLKYSLYGIEIEYITLFDTFLPLISRMSARQAFDLFFPWPLGLC